MKSNAIAATGTSGLSIEEMAKCYSEENRKRFCGIHFFNPPYNLTLCEVIPNSQNSKKSIIELSNYLKNTWKWDCNNDETLYLMLHINRLLG